LAGIAIYHGDHDDRFWDIRVGNTRLAEEDIQHVLYNAVKYYENKNLKESVILPTATTWSSYKPMLAEYGGGLDIFKCPSFESHSSVSDPLFDEFRYAFALSKAYDGFYMSQFMKSPSQLGAIVDAHNHKSYGVSGPNHIEVLSRAGQIMARHTDRTNFGYLDGHLELTPFEVFIPNEVQEELLGFRSDLSAKTSSWNHQNGPPKHSEYYK
jgi:prepilin-type processing-associated H-X9-DG protein